jgi:DNA polymerase I-like protein with 3'-5' exonuclease and polymerase domains
MKSIREIFLPDEREFFVKCDLSQAEDRFAKMYCNSKRMRELARRPPWEYDTHTENAKLIFGKEEISKQERYLGKKCVHASWRQMGGAKMSESVSHDTKGEVFLSPQKCQALIARYLQRNPEIEKNYFPWVEHQVRNVGVLVNSWGRRYDIKGLRITGDLLRACYSFYPQAENADWTNHYGMVPSHYYMWAKHGKTNSVQIHDEVVVSLPFKAIYDYCVFIKIALEQKRVIRGHQIWIPAEITISDTLYGGIEFEKLPEKSEFEKQLKEYFEEKTKNREE